MKKSLNGLLALGRSMVGLEGRPREFRVVNGGVPRFGWVTHEADVTASEKAADTPSEIPTVPAVSHPTAPTASTAFPSEPGASMAIPPSPSSRRSPRKSVIPLVRRPASWRWFGWFRRPPVGIGKPEQIELRLEDVRPLRSTLDAEDFLVVQPARPQRNPIRQNPFSVAPSGKTIPKAIQLAELPTAPTPSSTLPLPLAKEEAAAPSTPTTVPISEIGRLDRLTRWFRNREATAFK